MTLVVRRSAGGMAAAAIRSTLTGDLTKIDADALVIAETAVSETALADAADRARHPVPRGRRRGRAPSCKPRVLRGPGAGTPPLIRAAVPCPWRRHAVARTSKEIDGCPGPRTPRRAARSSRATERAPRPHDGHAPVPDPEAATGRGHLDRGPRADRGQRRHPPRAGRHRDRQLPRGDGDLPRRRRRHRRPAGPLPARDVPLDRPGHGPSDLHPARPQPGPQRPDRRPVHGPRADLRLAVHPQPRRGPALRHDRGLPQLREADLHEPHAPPRRRDVVRAGRPARQQAPFRDGLQPHPLLGSGVHGLGHAPEPRPGFGRHGQDRVRAGDARERARDHGPGQRQLPDVVGLQHARLGEGLRREQPGDADHPVHPRRRDGAGHGRGAGDADAGRGAGGDGVLPDRPAGRAGHLRLVRVVDVDAVGRAHVRHARSRSSCCSSWPRSPAGSASRSGAAATSRPPSCPTTRRRTRARSATWRRCRPASTSTSTRRAGSRAGSPSATRSSSSTRTRRR